MKILRQRPNLPYEKGKRTLRNEFYDICPCIGTNVAQGDQKNMVVEIGGGMANTLDTQQQQYTMISSTQKHATTMVNKSPALPGAMGEGGGHIPMLQGARIRRLTPCECARLQGFTDNWHEGVSDSQAYRCYGNAVTVKIVELIARRLKP